MMKCSIIIPTYNRPSYLKRILSYYSGYETTYNIIIADSSSDENKKINKDIISSFSNLNVQHLDNYYPETYPFHKIADAVNYVDTKYCVVCADDDFITPNGINQSVDFLEKNPDFTVAHGYYVTFWVKSDGGKEPQFCWRPRYSHDSITFSDPKSRLSHHLSSCSLPTFYGVHRTDLLKMIYKETLKAGIAPFFFGERLPSMLAIIYGKMKCLDMLYDARDGDSIRLSGYWPTIREAIKAGIYNEEYARFRDCLSTHLSKQSQLDIKESRKVVDDAMSAYRKKYSPSNPLIRKMGDILDYLRLPDWMDEGIRSLYRRLFLRKQEPDFSLGISPTYEYYDDLNKIRLHVLFHPKINLK